MKRLIAIYSIVAIISIVTYPSQATILNVPGTYPTIQSAIDAAGYGDKVIVADGTYTGTGNRDIDFQGKAITVCSENGPENCIIDCQGSAGSEHRGFYFHSDETSSAVLDGFTIKNGYKNPGAGIYCGDSDPIIKNCKITGNTAEWLNGVGGGCYFSNSFAEITNCQITYNSAIGTSPWSGNGWGGGIGIETNSNIVIANSKIMNNYATYSSGGIGVLSSSFSVVNSVISNNSSEHGAGLYFQDSSSTIMNSTIMENSAAFSGGGFYCIRSSVKVVNTILWGNTGGEIGGSDSSITVTYSDVRGGWLDEGNIDANPLFADADGRLLLGSPCINAGDNSAVFVTTDLEGGPRIVNGIVDMGAFETDSIAMLIAMVIDLDLPEGISESLLAKLDAAQKASDSVAINLLKAFVNAVEAQRGKQISEVDADYLIAAAKAIVAVL